ncbi:hypothetical protein [Thiolapillus sp.]
MSPVIRANWLLLAIAGLLGFIIHLHSQQQESHTPITTLDGSQISQILIKHKDTVIAQLQRQENGWTNLTTGKPAANREWIDKLLHIPRLPSLHHFPVAGLDLEAFGLQPPRHQLQLDGQTIRFGGIDPATGLRYVQVDQQIHLVSDGYTHYLSPDQSP